MSVRNLRVPASGTSIVMKNDVFIFYHNARCFSWVILLC
eukprot:UN06795